MLLKISTKHPKAADISYLLHKHPDKLQSVKLSTGKAHIFYPEFSQDYVSIAFLLDIDSIDMVRGNYQKMTDSFSLGQYVNDKPYTSSSFLSVAIAKAFSSALNGTCKDKPEAVVHKYPFEIELTTLRVVRGGAELMKRFFEPLGYTVQLEEVPLDTTFPDWGMSKYFNVKLTVNATVQTILSHLYILIPVLNDEKHYWVNESEVNKLLNKGANWLPNHPEKDQIIHRFLKNIKGLSKQALLEIQTVSSLEKTPEKIKKETLHDYRLQTVLAEAKKTTATSILDLGCGEGKFLKLLIREKQFVKIQGVEVSHQALQRAKKRLYYDDWSTAQKDRIHLIQGALTYRDKRLNNYDLAVLIEVIEHLDEDRLAAFEKVIFKYAQPSTVILTTPNREYNVNYENLAKGKFRHTDHRFEWTRAEFEKWANYVTNAFEYEVYIKPLGEVDPVVGAPSQMAVFTKKVPVV